MVFWDLMPLIELRAHVVERACAVAGGMDPDERARYLPDLPYERTCPT